MQIDIPNDDYQRLAGHAEAAGFSSVTAYVIAIAEAAPIDPRGALTSAELSASVEGLKASFADEAAGRTQGLREAIQDIAKASGVAFNR